MPTGRSRPLSPHLTIWRWQPPAIVSIVHRITGVGLALVGTPALVWFLCALAAGPQAYAGFLAFWSSWFGMVGLIGLTWAVFQHMLSGVRHLFYGYRRWLRTGNGPSVLVAGIRRGYNAHRWFLELAANSLTGERLPETKGYRDRLASRGSRAILARPFSQNPFPIGFP